MSMQSALAYLDRMRSDETFRRKINTCLDEAANWEFIRSEGFDFTTEEFKAALAYKEQAFCSGG